MRVPHLILTEDDLRGAVEELLHTDAFVVDVETTLEGPHRNTVTWVGVGAGGCPALIPLHHRTGVMVSPERIEKRLPPDEERKVLRNGKLSMAKQDFKVPPVYAPPPKQLPPALVFEVLRPLFFSHRGKIGHNVKFDLMSMAKYWGDLPPGPYHDTIVSTHLLDEDRPTYDLKTSILDWFGVGKVWSEEERRWVNNKYVRDRFYPNLGKQGVENQPLDKAARYLAKDVHYTWLMWVQRMSGVEKDGLMDAYQLEMDLYPVLMDMEMAGFAMDLALMESVGTALRKQLKEIEEAAWAITKQQFPLSNTNIRRDLLFNPKTKGGQGLKPRSVTRKTGTAQLDKAALEYYADRNELAKLFLDYSAAEKLRGTFIDGLGRFLVDGRLHTSYKQHGTVTGRLSSAEPNIQQIPRKSGVRNMFVADPGCTLVVADYDQIELRCAAYLSQDPNMMRVFMEGQDIHRAAAASMYRVSPEEVDDDLRQVGKTQNFSTLYGGGAGKLAAVAGVTEEEAEAFIRRYYKQFAGLEAWKERELRQARQKVRPYVAIPPYGRRRRLLELNHPQRGPRQRAERQAINALVQGFASNIMKMALIELRKALRPYGAQMLATVHDEVIVNVRDEDVADVIGVVSSTMSLVQSPDGGPILGEVPLLASAAKGHSWAEAKGK